MAKREEIFQLLEDLFAQHPWSYWQGRMRAAQIPCGEVRSVPDALRSPEAKARKLVTRVPHPKLGWIPNVRLPILYSGTPLADPRPAPAVGEHTQEILAEVLGYDDARIASLAASGALSPTPAKQQHVAAEASAG
jgi:crotonobetainyl-CoA:carnitine CoA-transferase CaiB-like acyl-CoA transferase